MSNVNYKHNNPSKQPNFLIAAMTVKNIKEKSIF
jgi:hypothetical protein